MQRIAVPMIGGMISSTLLIVIPAIFGLVKNRGLPRGERALPNDTAGDRSTIANAA